TGSACEPGTHAHWLSPIRYLFVLSAPNSVFIGSGPGRDGRPGITGGAGGAGAKPSGWNLTKARSAPEQHRAEVAAAEEVDVKMRHLLMGGGAGVGQHPVAGFGHPV